MKLNSIEAKNFLPAFYFILGLSLVLAITGYAVEGDVESSVTIDGINIVAETFNGSTTVFEGMTFDEVQDVSSLTLEKTSYGKIVWHSSINLTEVAGEDKTVNFDEDINLSDNLAYIDNSDLPYMDSGVDIYLYNLTFTNPRIIKGTSVCSDCELISYSGGTLLFNTTDFVGPYYAQETPVVCGNGVVETGEQCDDGNTVSGDGCSSTCQTESSEDDGGDTGGGGGGGGSTTPPSEDEEENLTAEEYGFIVEPDFFVLKMNRGSYFQKYLKITNEGTKTFSVSLGNSLPEFIFPQVNSFDVAPGESYDLRLDIYVSEKRPIDVYIGKLLFITSDFTKDVKVILDVEEKGALFDIKTEVLKKYINPGGRVRANVTIVNMGSLRNFDVSLEYKIVDFENNNYTIKKEDFAMDQAYFNVFYLDVPKDLSTGDYVFYTKVNYKEVSASSFDTFTVEKVSLLAWIIVVVVISIIIFLIVWRLRRDKRLERKARKAAEKEGKVSKPALVRRKIKVPRVSFE